MFFKDKEEYERYLSKNKVRNEIEDTQKYFNWSEDGEILLEKGMLRESALEVERYTNCICWVMLKDNETMALLKSQFGDIYRDLTIDDYYIAMYNNILLPEIANQLQNQSAKYYIAKNKPTKSKGYERKYLLTIDFKTKDEEIIHGEDILEDLNEDLR